MRRWQRFKMSKRSKQLGYAFGFDIPSCKMSRLATIFLLTSLVVFFTGVGVTGDSPSTSSGGTKDSIEKLEGKRTEAKTTVDHLDTRKMEADANYVSWDNSVKKHEDDIAAWTKETEKPDSLYTRFYQEKIADARKELANAIDARSKFGKQSQQYLEEEALALKDLADTQNKIDDLKDSLPDQLPLTPEEIKQKINIGQTEVKEYGAKLKEIRALVVSGNTSQEVEDALKQIQVSIAKKGKRLLELKRQAKAIEESTSKNEKK